MTIRWAKIFVFFACLAPLARLAWKGFHGLLGANPIEVITHSTGDWTLILLLVTLSITPLRKLTGQLWLIRFRRMVGLFAFFYASLHFTTYIWLDKFFDVHAMLKDIAERRFITVGLTAFVLLIPLAATSTAGWIRRLGGRRWNLLHQLIYVSAICGVIHYWWLVKADIRKPLQYAAVLALLLAYRVFVWTAKSMKPSSHLPIAPQLQYTSRSRAETNLPE
ncbi:MAG TPA: protein-methionine-sulfoxide reductase heme-binding subunit MsrQ [Terriglobales bacterium]|nr:protein-methionine-sulfoxide reductase heme-binding subunit MsrQ [Terriglobales bacterium]